MDLKLRLLFSGIYRQFYFEIPGYYYWAYLHMSLWYIDRIDRIDRIDEIFDILRGFGVLSSPEAVPRDNIHPPEGLE
jgi:hypothetical protein